MLKLQQLKNNTVRITCFSPFKSLLDENALPKQFKNIFALEQRSLSLVGYTSPALASTLETAPPSQDHETAHLHIAKQTHSLRQHFLKSKYEHKIRNMKVFHGQHI